MIAPTPGRSTLTEVAPRQNDRSTIAFRREQFEQLAERVPPFQLAGTIAMPALGAIDWFVGHRDLPTGTKVYAAAICAATALMFAVSFFAFRRAKASPDTVRLAAMFFVAVEVLLSFYLVTRVAVVGGTYAWLASATSLLIMQFIRIIVMPLSWQQSALGALVWISLPATWTAYRAVTGNRPPPPDSHATLVYTSVGFIFTLGTVFSTIGAKILQGLRRQSFDASQATRYQLERKLGRGGMGEVYVATHGTLKTECAIKVCRFPPGTDANTMSLRFEREAQQVAKLEHPHIVRVFDYGQMEDGALYFAMEYLRGVDLEAFLERHGAVPEDRLLAWADQVLRALAHAHGRGVVHRDLKPGNLLLADLGGEPDFVKVLDFGLAKVMTSNSEKTLTQAGDMAGTPWYMSPEQARGEKTLDHRTDLYAMGAILHHLASGKHVFDADSALGALVRHLNDPPPPLRQDAPAASAELEAVVSRLLAKKPEDRFPDASSVRDALLRSPHWGRWTRDRALAWWAANPRAPSQAVVAAHDATLPASSA